MMLPLVVIAIQIIWFHEASGHGSLIQPPSRAAMGLHGFPQNGINYNHNEGFCGGFAVQYQTNNGKCGICGDAWNANPRAHEAPGGKYANGIITGRYQPGANMDVTVKLTANHKGYFTFRLCKSNNPSDDPDQSCFEQSDSLLRLTDGSTRFAITTEMGNRDFKVQLRLPDWTCTQCILQWTYTTGNSWGICPDGSGALGCGPQETFRACSDIEITGDTIVNPTLPPVTVPPPVTTPASTTSPPSTSSTQTPRPTQSTTSSSGGSCEAVGAFAGSDAMAQWCTTNCNHNPPYCPADRCKCGSAETPATFPTSPPTPITEPTPGPTPITEPTPGPTPVTQPTPGPTPVTQPTPVTEPTPAPTTRPTTATINPAPGGLSCASVGAYAGDSAMSQWCFINCNHNPPFCPSDRCECLAAPKLVKDGCKASGPWSGNSDMDTWCNTNCNHSPPFCPVDMCSCTRQEPETTPTQEPTTEETTTSPAACYMENKMMKGRMISTVAPKAASRQDCSTRCAGTPKCKAFTFIEQHRRRKLRKRCYLFSRVKRQITRNGYVSGIMNSSC